MREVLLILQQLISLQMRVPCKEQLASHVRDVSSRNKVCLGNRSDQSAFATTKEFQTKNWT